MKRAVLIGNGVTSQLIDDYKDYNMIKKVKDQIGDMYYEIDNLLTPFRNLKIKDESSICKVLSELNIERHHYQRYFVEQNLLEELNNKHICALETLLKVAHLFNHIKKFDYDFIKSVANVVYYNCGKNGIDNINAKNFSIEYFTNFINDFDYVFTTNFDSILDDVYKKEVFHLHGGFHYRKFREPNGAIFITKDKTKVAIEDAYLIWGRNHREKESQTKGGFSFPISFPFCSGSSILDEYFDELKNDDFEELHIWGYSGLNDNHINQQISANSRIKKIYCYVSPDCIVSEEIFRKMNKLYNPKNNHKIIIKSWEEIWEKFKTTKI